MREKKKHFSPISGILSNAIKKKEFREKVKTYKLWSEWLKIMGEQIAAHSCPLKWQKDALLVAVEHPTWVHELTLLKPKLLKKLNEHYPATKISDIRFVVEPLPYRHEKKEEDLRPARVPSNSEMEFIEQAAIQIKDPDIREAALKAMMKGFERKRD